MEDKK